MLRELINKGLTKFLLPLAIILAFVPGISAWNYYYLRGSDSDYAGGKRVALTWNGSENQYEGTLTVTEDAWTCKVTVGNSENEDNTWFGPTSDTTVSGQTDFGVQSDGSKDFTFTKGTYYLFLKTDGNNQGWNPNHLYITGGGGGVVTPAKERPDQLYVNVMLADGTSYPVLMRLSDNGKQFHGIVNGFTSGDKFNFNFRENELSWDGYKLYPDNANTPAATGAIKNYTTDGGEPNGNWVYTLTENKNVILRVDLTDLDNPKLKVETISKTGQEYYLHAGFLGNWDKNQRVKFLQYTDDPTLLRAVAIYKEANAGNPGFKITNKATADNGNWYSAGQVLGNGVEFNQFVPVTDAASNRDFGSTKNTTLDESALFQTVTFYLTLNEDGSIKSLKPEWIGEAAAVTDDMPVYPIGVYTEAALKRYDQWPVMYLQARVLNNNRITPEYQFTQVTPDRYELELTMRSTKMRNNKDGNEYDNYGTVITVKGFNNAYSAVETFVDYGSFTLPKTQATDGARYKAICQKQEDGTWKLSFEPIGEINDLPFLAMVGGGWVQREVSKTPNPDSSGNVQTTNNGWQESWIQYDSRGNVLRDRKGNVMYNTMWPPRNPILFKTEFEIGGTKKDFTLSSKDLTFKNAGTMTGKEWKEKFFSEYQHTNLSYTSDESKPWEFNAPREYENLLALDDNTTYTLYRVENMWINSSWAEQWNKPYGVKIWSGWMGDINQEGDKQAIWCNHSNWGHVDGVKGELGYLTYIKPFSSEPLYNDQGDMAFSKPTFFKYVNFFYDVNKPQTVGHSVLFTELTIGGAQIAAVSTNDYTVGNYQPALSNIDPEIRDYKVKSVQIRSYLTTTNNGQESEEMVTRVFNWTGSKAIQEFHTIFDSESGNSELPSEGNLSDDGYESTAKWVKDSYDYKSGDYFYKMIVVITDSNNKDHTIVVDSNPFTIIKPEALTLNVYQLVKIGDDSEDTSTDIVTSEYYTFKGEEGNAIEPTLPAYKITIVNDSKFDSTDPTQNPEYDENGDLISGYIDDTNFEFSYESLDELPDYGANCRFTDKVLIVGSVPTAQNVEGYAYGAGNVNSETPANGPQRIAITEDYDRSCQRADNGDRFMHVTNIGSFENREFTLKMAYSNMVLDEDGKYELIESETDPVSANYVAVIPEPQLREAKVDVFYGKDLDGDGNNDYADFKFRNLDLEAAHFHSVRDHIEIEMPNVSEFLRERMIKEDFFSIKMDTKEDPNRPEQVVWSNVFSFNTDRDKPNFIDGEEQENGDPNLNIVTVHGKFLAPELFNYDRAISLIYSAEDKNATPENYKYNYYPRWKDGMVHKLDITDKAPVEMDHVLVNPSISLKDSYVDENGEEKNYADGRHLISEFTINIMHKDSYDPEENEEGHNYLTSSYQDSNADGTLKFDEDGNPVIKTEQMHLHHHSEADYYYVTIIDSRARDEETLGDDDAKITTNGLLASRDIDTKAQICQYVIPANRLLNGGYYPVTIKKDYGTIDQEGLNFSKFVEEITTNHYAKNLKVLVSYLYPFNVDRTPSNKPGLSREAADQTGVVIKSQANIGEVNTDAVRILTGVDEVLNELPGYVKVGAGFIEVEGTGVQIINAAGVTVAEGEGHHDVTAGVYVVRYSGKTTKVVVR